MMTEDEVGRSLEELRRDTWRLRGRLRRAVRTGQSTRDGSDPTGAITVLLDDDGIAGEIRVAGDWRQRLGPGNVADAVRAADADAARRRAVATAEALADDDGSHESTVDADGPVGAGGPEPFGAVPAPMATPRTLAELTEATWAALDDLDRLTGELAPVTGIGADGAVRLELHLGRVVSCAVEATWLDRQDAAGLAHGLREALDLARAADARERRPAAEFQQRVTDLLATVHASMSALTTGRLA
jgi:hypothetical protein